MASGAPTHAGKRVTSNIASAGKAPVTPNGVATAFVQRSKTMWDRRGIHLKYQSCQL